MSNPGVRLAVARLWFEGNRFSPRPTNAQDFELRALRITDGRCVNTGPMERGAAVTVGRSVVLDVQGVKTIVTESAGAANDPAFFALHGIELAATRLLVVKAKNHFRAAFAPLLATIVDADCPGPAAADLASLPFRNAPLSRPSRPRP